MGSQTPALALTRDWIATGVLPSLPDAALARAIVATAEIQGVAGLLAAAVRAAGDWPHDACTQLNAIERALLVRNVRHLDLAARIHDRLLEGGLRTLPLKSAALVERLYDSPARRAMADVDLLVLDDWRACARALDGEGLRRLAAGDHAAPFLDPATGFTLELHVSPVSCPGLFPVDAEGLWRRSQAGNGQIPRVPALEDALVQLALHSAFQHGCVLSLGQHLDLRRLCERLPLDLPALRTRAREAHAEPALAAALRAAQIVTALRPPPEIAALIDAHLPRRLARWLDDRAADPLTLLLPAHPELARLRFALTPGRHLTLLRHTLFARPLGEEAPLSGRIGRVVRRALRLLLSVRGGRAPRGSRSA